jgi:hypothetical protein
MAVHCEAASKFAGKSTGQSVRVAQSDLQGKKKPGNWLCADKPIADSASVRAGCKANVKVERGWLQLREADCESRGP